MSATEQVLSFIRDTTWDNLPAEVQHQSKRCLMDTLGALLAGHGTPVGEMMENVVKEQFPGDQATILVSGTRVSAAGAALANGFAGNALDIDDGYRNVKGHPGACVLPPLLCAAQIHHKTVSGTDFLTALVVGYEVGIRAGLIRHATYETYHSSGSWGAVAGAASAGKLLDLSPSILQNALGAAEYHAPIAPMMKCIAVPGMGKDSIGWGCMVAVMSVLMAQKGFTGIHPMFDDSPEVKWIEDLGEKWEIQNLYFKPYSACRWAQPGVDGVLQLMEEYSLFLHDIEQVTVYTFQESAALSCDPPQNTEEAQYNIAFPIAAALLDGEVGPAQILPPRLFDTDIRQMMKKVRIIAQERFQIRFPEKAESEVVISTRDGRTLHSGVMSASWDPHSFLPTDQELIDKFLWLSVPVMGKSAADALVDTIWKMDDIQDLNRLFMLCCKAVSKK